MAWEGRWESSCWNWSVLSLSNGMAFLFRRGRRFLTVQGICVLGKSCLCSQPHCRDTEVSLCSFGGGKALPDYRPDVGQSPYQRNTDTIHFLCDTPSFQQLNTPGPCSFVTGSPSDLLVAGITLMWFSSINPKPSFHVVLSWNITFSQAFWKLS